MLLWSERVSLIYTVSIQVSSRDLQASQEKRIITQVHVIKNILPTVLAPWQSVSLVKVTVVTSKLEPMV